MRRFYRITLGIWVVLVSPCGFAQPAQKLQEEVFTIVEKAPEYPGSKEALATFLEANLNYPNEAQKAHVKGRALVSFIVNRDGSLEDFRAESDFRLGYGCEEEALRVAKLMPNWIPGSQSGAKVRVKYNLAIWFPVEENRKRFLKK